MDHEFDIIIKNGTIHDGGGSPEFKADLAVKSDRVVKIGSISTPARRVIDAVGLIVTPGFIDVHTHCDSTFMLARNALERAAKTPSWKGNHNYLFQGVTTVVSGNCGEGFADLDEWFDLLDQVGFGTNVYHLAPHGQIRASLFGKNQPTVLSPGELDALVDKVEEAMSKGAVGLSSGLVYAPGFLASTDELIAVAKAASKYGRIYASHIRDESGRIDENGQPGLLNALAEAFEIGRQAEAGVNISHLKITAPHGNVTPGQVLDFIETARGEGLDVTADQYPYDAGSSRLTLMLPNHFLESGGVKDQYKKGAGRDEVRAAVEETFQYMGPEKMMVSEYHRERAFEGKNLVEISEIVNRPAADVFVEMVCDGQPPLGVFFAQDMAIVDELALPDFVITGSDGWTTPLNSMKPHPRCYGTFPKKIRRYVNEKKSISLEKAIRSMTSLPAEKFKMKDRGRLKEGYFADVVVIDPAGFKDRATYLNPHQYASGVEYLLVNGVLSIDSGQTTGKEGGRAVRAG